MFTQSCFRWTNCSWNSPSYALKELIFIFHSHHFVQLVDSTCRLILKNKDSLCLYTLWVWDLIQQFSDPSSVNCPDSFCFFLKLRKLGLQFCISLNTLLLCSPTEHPTKLWILKGFSNLKFQIPCIILHKTTKTGLSQQYLMIQYQRLSYIAFFCCN